MSTPFKMAGFSGFGGSPLNQLTDDAIIEADKIIDSDDKRFNLEKSWLGLNKYNPTREEYERNWNKADNRAGHGGSYAASDTVGAYMHNVIQDNNNNDE